MILSCVAFALVPAISGQVGGQTVAIATLPGYELNDSHFHLTNYIQEGTDLRKFVDITGTKVGRVALFGIPLQQQWSYGNTGDHIRRVLLTFPGVFSGIGEFTIHKEFVSSKIAGETASLTNPAPNTFISIFRGTRWQNTSCNPRNRSSSRLN